MQIIKGVAIAAVLIIAGLLDMPLGRTGKCRTTKRGNNNAFGDREQQAA